MEKAIFALIAVLGLAACNMQLPDAEQIEEKIERLENAAAIYKALQEEKTQ